MSRACLSGACAGKNVHADRRTGCRPVQNSRKILEEIMPITDLFTEKKVQRNLACFLAPEAEYSPEQFEEMKNPSYGIMNAAKLRMNEKTEIIFFTEETPLLLQLFQTIDENSVVETLGGLYYHLSEIAGSDILDGRNLMVDPEHIYFDVQSNKVFIIYLPIRMDGERLTIRSFPEIGEIIAAQIDKRFGEEMPPALKALREALYDETMEASEIFAKINALYPIKAAKAEEIPKSGEEIPKSGREKSLAVPESKTPDRDDFGMGRTIADMNRRKGSGTGRTTDSKSLRKGGLKISIGRKTDLSNAGTLEMVPVSPEEERDHAEKERILREEEERDRAERERILREEEERARAEAKGVRLGGKERYPADEELVYEGKADELRIPMIMQLTLTSRETGQQIMLEENSLVIGRRTPEAMGVLRNAPNTVGRKHAEICRVGDRFFIRDLESRNGTMINGRLISPMELYPLSDGDKVSLAKFVLDVRVNEI